MSTVIRIGVIGLGNMGSTHCETLLAKKIPHLELTAVSDLDPQAVARYPQRKGFASPIELIRSGLVDAVIIATPHYDHTPTGIAALQAGLHVLIEKPISVHKADCERLIAAYEQRSRRTQVFAAMFNQRTDPHYGKVRKMIQGDELGEIRRINWIITDWFRTEAYYASGGWRATWKGEGGGILINQCPHNLDLLQWLFGMPSRVRAFCRFGQWHDIETEDDVTAWMEFPNGATGVFVTTSGEAPGTNRLEIAAEHGKIVVEGAKIIFTRNLVPMSQFSRTNAERFARPEAWHIDIPVHGHGGQHSELLQNFADAILDGKPLIAPGVEGIRSVELANAMLLSTLLDRTIELPLDGEIFAAQLQKLVGESKFEKAHRAAAP